MKRSVKMVVLPFFPLQFLRSRYEIDYNLLHFQKNINGTPKIHALPNFRSGDNRWINFAPVNNATFQNVLQPAECGVKYLRKIWECEICRTRFPNRNKILSRHYSIHQHYSTVQVIEPPKKVFVEEDICTRIDGCRIVDNVCIDCLAVKN